MDKRTLLAITLSLFFLLTYNSFLPKKNVNQTLVSEAKMSQQIDAQRDTSLSKSEINDFTQKSVALATASQQAEVAEVIENKELELKLSNIGGTIKQIHLNQHNITIPVSILFNLDQYDKFPFSWQGNNANRAVYTFSDSKYKITKTYEFPEDSHLILAELEVKNISGLPQSGKIILDGFRIDNSRLDNNVTPVTDQSLFEYSVSEGSGMSIFRKGNATKFSPKENIYKPVPVKWAGFRDKYFAFILKPEFTTTQYTINVENEKELTVGFGSDNFSLEPGSSVTYKASAYVGPQDIATLKRYNNGFEEIVAFSNFGIIDWAAKMIVKIMSFIHNIIPNWGISIILVSLFIYGALYPLTMQSMLSMRKMQSLQPKMNQLRDQHKNNPQKLNKEIMELYKTNKVNPMSGCLPLLLQMPIFIALYQVLWRSIALKGQTFLWIKDLAQPDRLFVFPAAIPLIGNELNILPILMALVMFFQQKLSNKNMVTTDPAQLMQQKMMMLFLPVFIGFMFYHFSSALALYFTVFYALSSFTQWKMSKVVVVAK